MARNKMVERYGKYLERIDQKTGLAGYASRWAGSGSTAVLRPLFLVLIILFGVFFPCVGYAAEIPKVIHFTKQQYNAQNQNWSISQGSDLRMFFGNSSGLLMYDGAHWQTFSRPGDSAVRAISCDAQGRIFIGGYTQAGYWAPDERGQLKYHPILDEVMEQQAQKEEIWHFLPTERGLFFQSFATIYRYFEGEVEVIRPPGNLMFLREVNNRILAPVIHEGMYEYLPDGRFVFLSGTHLLAGKRVAAILPQGKDTLLIATENDGFFHYTNGILAPWVIPISEELTAAQVNKAIRLSNGNMAVGTILNGIYIFSAEGKRVAHVNQENGLQNNTVLALYEDQANNLWAALDKGIDLILTNPSLSFYTDKKGEVGSVFAAALFGQRLYIGTNHGVFFKDWPSKYNDGFRLVSGSQGQAWELKVYDEQLFCAHNSGILKIVDNAKESVYSSTGVYHILDFPLREGYLLLATYTGLAMLRRDSRGKWSFSHTVKGFSASAKHAFFDSQGRLWVAHPHRGVYCLRFNEELTEVSALPILQTEGFPPLEKLSASISFWEGRAYIWPDSGKLAYDTRGEPVEIALEDEAFSGYRSSEKWIAGRNGAQFRLFPNHTEFISAGLHALLPVSSIPGDERIVSLNDSLYLIGTEEGYAIFNPQRAKDKKELRLPAPLISAIEIKDKPLEIHAVEVPARPLFLQSSRNCLWFLFALPFYQQQVSLRYRLIGFDEAWSASGRMYNKEYTNLAPGQYEFQVQSDLSPQITSFSFVIEPHWYQKWWAKLVFLALAVLLGVALFRAHERRMARQRRRLEIQKERELQQQKVYSRNEMLEAKVISKSRQLADSAMNLVRKNEILIKLNKELKLLKKNKENIAPPLHKMIRLIDNHLSSEEDWKAFESNFNQLHDQFFKRLKAEYPDLTPGDLRLAAYLKMNLSSKEIASLLNISLRGVENKRYRLRRKMKLEAGDNLAEFLMQY